MDERQRKLLAYIRAIQERDGITVIHLEEMLAANKERLLTKAEFTLPDKSLGTWERFDKALVLRPDDYVQLESVILQNGLRPAYDIRHDSYETLPSLWQPINNRRSVLQSLIRGIGRLDLTGHPIKRNIGTGFICGEHLLMTNRHVADEFVSRREDGGSLVFNPGIGAFLDLKQEVDIPESSILEITAPIMVLDDWDVALFEFRQLPPEVRPLPLAKEPPRNMKARMAAVVGYPCLDPESDLVQQLQIFRNIFEKKRIMPGRLTGLVQVISYGRSVEAVGHDCTTLGGNSGSALIDVESGLVVGVHFAGQYLVSNYAVPVWELANEPRIKDRGLNYVTI